MFCFFTENIVPWFTVSKVGKRRKIRDPDFASIWNCIVDPEVRTLWDVDPFVGLKAELPTRIGF